MIVAAAGTGGRYPMRKFEWLGIFELGVPEIDNDHKKLLALAKHIGPAIFDVDHTKCESAVEEFIALAIAHFKREEDILRQLGYPGLQEHAKYHVDMIASANKLKIACRALKGADEIEECYWMMTSFLVDDFIRGDFAFKSFLQTKGYGSKEPASPRAIESVKGGGAKPAKNERTKK